MKTFSIETRLEGRPVVVVGACGECAMKVERLIDAGAEVRVFAGTELHPKIDAWSKSGDLTLVDRALREADLEKVILAYVSPTLECPALLIAWEAAGHMLCHLDRPEIGSFINPASTQGGTVRFSISTGGKAPALARRFRESLEGIAKDPELEAFVEALSELRERTPSAERRTLLNQRLEGFDFGIRLVFPSWFARARE